MIVYHPSSYFSNFQDLLAKRSDNSGWLVSMNGIVVEFDIAVGKSILRRFSFSNFQVNYILLVLFKEEQ